jgi:hypothetical protein
MKEVTLASDNDSEVFALYDENRNLILDWQAGDDITRIFKKLFNNLNIQFQTESFSVDGFVPEKI